MPVEKQAGGERLMCTDKAEEQSDACDRGGGVKIPESSMTPLDTDVSPNHREILCPRTFKAIGTWIHLTFHMKTPSFKLTSHLSLDTEVDS